MSGMFNKFAQATSTRGSSRKPSTELVRTTEFVRAVVDEGLRLSYGALAAAAKILGENTSGQSPAQRGSALVKALPLELQPYVCQKSGRYAKGVTWDVSVPGDLRNRPVIQRTAYAKDWDAREIVEGAVEIWLASQEEPEDEDEGELIEE